MTMIMTNATITFPLVDIVKRRIASRGLYRQTDTSSNQPQLFHLVSTTFSPANFNFLECTRDIGQTHTISCG